MTSVMNEYHLRPKFNFNSYKDENSEIQVMEFLSGKEQFAINLYDVREVNEKNSITPLPKSPNYIKGIIDLRGEVTSIIDLKKRMSIIEDNNYSPISSRIIVLDDKNEKKKDRNSGR
ncbi:chemotaxis protein CheW [Methanospirillum sp. J.3.6.1-F.2.7.3]|jgi:purine-binding chemotaxis protein CheW|uniref:Chemotaxis protein CheW n=1 Tax=Methanospirillum purgamenti TaxID=2834276 RepID=A0A8E7B344_9EURY|nr:MULTISPECIES: chemotaxis protein CheW [Methanospirillum]MDX8550916.1 chemotaxis protein CheW [Methanospirillum hungatei]QVV90206.1 chemotaxis protein CheW [Methanospirillum sp. J.3.6.1-F.2.7.3]